MSTHALTTEIDRRDFEQVVLCRDPEAGLRSVIAIHDTTLGPSLGGIRMRHYAADADALADALDLAEAMTYKAALAGLELGGGKSVINADPTSPDRDRIIAAHARYVGALGGRYIPSVDMGTTVADLELVARHVAVVASQRRDPSWFTAKGVVRSIEAALQWSGEKGLSGTRISVQGLGHVGQCVVAMLSAAGAEVLIADVDEARVRSTMRHSTATAVPTDEILLADADVVCPCGPGAVVTEAVAEHLKARYLIGAANNMLAEEYLASALVARGIVYVPDFVSNAGGLIAAAADLRGTDDGLHARVDGIAATTVEILEAAPNCDAVTVAKKLARDRLAQRRVHRPHFAETG
jgi:leucine dehydrogenase